jgi:hypothetical protein
MSMLPSPIECEWERLKNETFIARKAGVDTTALRAAFDYGFNRGIAYACSQIEWDIQNRASDPTPDKHGG